MVWQVLRKVRIVEWLVEVIMILHKYPRISVRVNGIGSDDLAVIVDTHQMLSDIT